MPEFQLLRCRVALGGDNDNTVYRHRGVPIMFPELPILQSLHGDLAVMDVYVVGTCEMTNEEALMRVRLLYGDAAVKEVFPGTRPRLPTADGTIPFCTMPIYVPKPTVPDNPDPKLRPLDQYTMTPQMPRVPAPDPVIEDEPTADEIAAHAQDDEDEDEDPGFDLPHRVVPDGQPMSAREVLAQARANQELQAQQPQTRTSFRSQARQARRTPDHLPDVVSEPPKTGSGNHDHDRPRG